MGELGVQILPLKRCFDGPVYFAIPESGRVQCRVVRVETQRKRSLEPRQVLGGFGCALKGDLSSAYGEERLSASSISAGLEPQRFVKRVTFRTSM